MATDPRQFDLIVEQDLKSVTVYRDKSTDPIHEWDFEPNPATYRYCFDPDFSTSNADYPERKPLFMVPPSQRQRISFETRSLDENVSTDSRTVRFSAGSLHRGWNSFKTRYESETGNDCHRPLKQHRATSRWMSLMDRAIEQRGTTEPGKRTRTIYDIHDYVSDAIADGQVIDAIEDSPNNPRHVITPHPLVDGRSRFDPDEWNFDADESELSNRHDPPPTTDSTTHPDYPGQDSIRRVWLRREVVTDLREANGVTAQALVREANVRNLIGRTFTRNRGGERMFFWEFAFPK